ncbi:MAG: hypothetical protein HDS06_09105, partial [Bacteroides sp.]|nr:hypothetical protein [Bacteroides sp.]
MGRKIEFDVNIDRLEIAYQYNESEVMDILSNLNENGEKQYDCFKIVKSNIQSEFEHNFDIICDSLPSEEGKVHEINWGVLQWGSHRKKDIYISVSNEMFYNGTLPYLHYIDSELSLSFKKVNKLDIALDININLVRRFYKMLKDETYTPIIFNKAYAVMTEKIPNLVNMGSGSRLRPYKNKSFDIRKQTRFKSLSLHCYDKLEEVKDNEFEKQYILDKVGLKPMFRLEIRSNADELNYTLEQMNITNEDLYHLLFNEPIISEVYFNLLDRVI